MSEPTMLSSSPQALVLYTDGACRGNPGPGGWAALLSTDDQVRWYAGRDGRTTNNRMEILAAIKGLEQTPPGRQVTIVSDSQYLVNTMTKGWQRKKNHDLWGQLDALVKGRSVTWEWIYGHAGHPLNEEADRLARAAAKDSQWGERSGVLMANMSSAQVDDAPSQPETESPRLSHLDEKGRARMVDVSPKDETERAAVAKGA
ncbi:MAG TPA: RNase H family protein, partial [Dehalococcoidia bacterium]|nr:RNase H family protein [Dehalococcoidia bacterium]